METQQNVPVFVKIISVLFYLKSIAFILGGILFMFLGGISLSSLPLLGSFGFILGVVPGMLGVLILAWGLLHFFTGRGLWKGAKWGKTLAIIVSGLYIVLSIVEIVKLGVVDYISLIINTAIIIYLLFFYKDN